MKRCGSEGTPRFLLHLSTDPAERRFKHRLHTRQKKSLRGAERPSKSRQFKRVCVAPEGVLTQQK